MEKQIFPKREWNKEQFESLKKFEKDLEDRLAGGIIELEYLDTQDKHTWKKKRINVSKVEYRGNEKGYVDVDGPVFYDSEGKAYHTHPDYGIRIIE